MPPAKLRQVLADLEAAESPKDFQKFYAYVHGLKATPEGQRAQKEWAALEVKETQVFLRQLQADLHRVSARRLAEYRARLRSPKRDQLRCEIVPAKVAKLRSEIAAEEARAQKAVLKELGATLQSDLPVFLASIAHYGEGQTLTQPAPKTSAERQHRKKERQRRAWKNQDSKPDRPTLCLWSKPMTIADYRTATGMGRGAVEDFLRDKLKVHAGKRRTVTVSWRYPVSVNLKVLGHWIERWVRKGADARGLAAATVAYAHAHDTAAFVARLSRTLAPVLARRRVDLAKLTADVKAHRELNVSPEPDPFTKLLAVNP